jgi:hypothetical protein
MDDDDPPAAPLGADATRARPPKPSSAPPSAGAAHPARAAVAWIRQMAAVQRPATREYIDRNWPKPVREALLGPDRPTG